MKNLVLDILKSTILAALLLMVIITGCERSVDGLEEPGFTENPEVFIDGFSSGLEYYPFADSKQTAFSVSDEDYEGNGSSMRFDVPNVGDPDGSYAGAIFRDDNGGRDLTSYNALTFYAKGTIAGTLNEVGFGQDFFDNKYQVAVSGLRLTTNWAKYTIPIPDASNLTSEQGLFWYAEGPEDGNGYSFWVDDLKYENLSGLAQPRPAINNGIDDSETSYIGSTFEVPGLTYTINQANGIDVTVGAAPAYYTFSSSDPSIATVNENGLVSVVGQGTTEITATLDGVQADGTLTVQSEGNFTPAPTPPDRDAEDVISIFSDAYDNVPVTHYNGYWDGSTTQGQNDINVNGNEVIRYTDINYHGIEFLDNLTIDATEMTHFHIDIFVENTLSSSDFIELTLQDLGIDNAFGGSNDPAGTIRLTTTSNPPLVNGAWVSVDVPLSRFTGLTTRANLAQLVFVTQGTFSGNPSSITEILVDNIYFYKE